MGGACLGCGWVPADGQGRHGAGGQRDLSASQKPPEPPPLAGGGVGTWGVVAVLCGISYWDEGVVTACTSPPGTVVAPAAPVGVVDAVVGVVVAAV